MHQYATNPRLQALEILREIRPEVHCTYHFLESEIVVKVWTASHGETEEQTVTSPRHLENDEEVFVACLQVAVTRLDQRITQALLPGVLLPDGFIAAGYGPFTTTDWCEDTTLETLRCGRTGESVSLAYEGPILVKWGSLEHRFLSDLTDEIPPPVVLYGIRQAIPLEDGEILTGDLQRIERDRIILQYTLVALVIIAIFEVARRFF